MKKLAAICLCVILAVSMVSCGSSSGNTDSKDPSSGSASSRAESSTPDSSKVESSNSDSNNAESSNSDSSNAEIKSFTELDDYQNWAKETGYTNNYLCARGIEGINMDYFHTLPGEKAYTSGKIVIGDSRCCQMGILQHRNGKADFADFAIWGGHFTHGVDPAAMNDELISEVTNCFKAQIEACGECKIYFFATVNDYDFQKNNNADNIKGAVSAAEKLAALSYDYNGKTYHPHISIIGFEGSSKTEKVYGIEPADFNRYVEDYNKKLLDAIKASGTIKGCADTFTTVAKINDDKVSFITDQLHYSDETLGKLIEYVKAH
ncbi:hypothetical protein [Ruminococcus sp. FC2018]|uniref:hypothetical protein n=1 Tax=Ruminococcus sp. FC2018 TaxID=1410617 RepID=UPI0004915782|nr:hypothetical protein [Ruminococcus sp. FC2018]